VEEPAFLIAVQPIVGSVEVKHDLARRLGVCIKKQVDEQGFDRHAVMTGKDEWTTVDPTLICGLPTA
jgi:hypothetical protein